VPGRWSAEALDDLIRGSSGIAAGERIALLSETFLGTPYRESTLIGNGTTPEVLVVNLGGVDCFTFIDYVEAMRLSGSFSEFAEQLKRVRYRSGGPAFAQRNHFFTDWAESNKDFVEDITVPVSGGHSEKIVKVLNRKEDGTQFIRGIPSVERVLDYIPSRAVDRAMLKRLKTGDYAGIYSSEPGLDVSHVGVVINVDGMLYLRHASIRYRRVVDEDFAAYVAGTPGLIVLRPREKK
jgi:hypothetical protein